MFLSTLQPSSTFTTPVEHGISMERTAIETELSYLANVDASTVTVDVIGDHIVLEGAVKSSVEMARVLRVAQEVVGFNRVLSRLIICSF
jgi:osmotically-inducible protein OsmY